MCFKDQIKTNTVFKFRINSLVICSKCDSTTDQREGRAESSGVGHEALGRPLGTSQGLSPHSVASELQPPLRDTSIGVWKGGSAPGESAEWSGQSPEVWGFAAAGLG